VVKAEGRQKGKIKKCSRFLGQVSDFRLQVSGIRKKKFTVQGL